MYSKGLAPATTLLFSRVPIPMKQPTGISASQLSTVVSPLKHVREPLKETVTTTLQIPPAPATFCMGTVAAISFAL